MSREELIIPVEKQLLIQDLNNNAEYIGETKHGGNHLYIFGPNAKHLTRENSRLKEWNFRNASPKGGTGMSSDYDIYDFAGSLNVEDSTKDDIQADSLSYKNVGVWDPVGREFIACYRFKLAWEAPIGSNGQRMMDSSKLFHYSDKFNEEFMPHAIILGRSYVNFETSNPKLRTGLHNVWDGLGKLVERYHDQANYLMGKVTVYDSFDPLARDLLNHFFRTYTQDDSLAKAINPVVDFKSNKEEFVLETFHNVPTDKAFGVLKRAISSIEGAIFPQLINSYLRISDPLLSTFGTSAHKEFGEVEETGIILTLDDVLPKIRISHYPVPYLLKTGFTPDQIISSSMNRNIMNAWTQNLFKSELKNNKKK